MELWSATPKLTSHDLTVWNEIEEKCFTVPFLSFLESHDFFSSFWAEELEPLREIGHFTRNDTYFINKRIGQDFEETQKIGAELYALVCKHYSPVGDEKGLARLSHKKKEEPKTKADIERMNALAATLHPKMLQLKNTLTKYKQTC